MGKTVFYIYPCYFSVKPTPGGSAGTAWFRYKEWANAARGGQVNLGLHPGLVGTDVGGIRITWPMIQSDYHQGHDARGETTVGPVFPNKCSNNGAVGLTDTCLQIMANRPLLPPEGFDGLDGSHRAHEYEFISVQYWDKDTEDPGDRRFRGYHAERLDATTVKIWYPGTSGDPHPTPLVVQHFEWGNCDAVAGGHSTIDATSAQTVGALFINTSYAYGQLNLVSPKLPLGWETLNIRLEQTSPSPAYLEALSRTLGWSVDGFKFDANPALAEIVNGDRYRRTHYSFDIIGHSKGGDSLLELYDGRLLDEKVVESFRPFFTSDVFRSLGVRQIRLLGCRTAQSTAGKRAMFALETLASVPVYGTRDVITNANFDHAGFRDDAKHLLTRAEHVEGVRPVDRQPLATRATVIATTSEMPADWLGTVVEVKRGQLAAPMLAAPDLVIRRADGSIDVEVFLTLGVAYRYPARDATVGMRYPLLPGLISIDQMIKFV